jgi:hypothetical protein
MSALWGKTSCIKEKKRSRSRYFERKRASSVPSAGYRLTTEIGSVYAVPVPLKQKRHRPSNLAVGQRKWAISHLPRFHKRADEFGKLIIDWMMSKELTFSAAESRLGWTTDRLRQMVTSKTKHVESRRRQSHLAETLGEDHALGGTLAAGSMNLLAGGGSMVPISKQQLGLPPS